MLPFFKSNALGSVKFPDKWSSGSLSMNFRTAWFKLCRSRLLVKDTSSPCPEAGFPICLHWSLHLCFYICFTISLLSLPIPLPQSPPAPECWCFEPVLVYKLRDVERNPSEKSTYSGVRSPRGPSHGTFWSLGATSPLTPPGKDSKGSHHTEAEICGHIWQEGASAQGSSSHASVLCGQTWVQGFARW